MIFPSLIVKIERWKFNKDYGIYVSTLGNFKDRYKRRLPIRINSRTGYCHVKTERGYRPSHRMVMLTWRPIPDAESLTVDHLNHNKRDNSLENLEWVSREENLRRAREDAFDPDPEEDFETTLAQGDRIIFYVNGKPFPSVEEALKYVENSLTPNLGCYKREKALHILKTRPTHIGQTSKYCGFTFKAEKTTK